MRTAKVEREKAGAAIPDTLDTLDTAVTGGVGELPAISGRAASCRCRVGHASRVHVLGQVQASAGKCMTVWWLTHHACRVGSDCCSSITSLYRVFLGCCFIVWFPELCTSPCIWVTFVCSFLRSKNESCNSPSDRQANLILLCSFCSSLIELPK